MAADGHGVSFWGDEHVLELDSGDGCTTVNILRTNKLYTLKGCILHYVNYIPIKKQTG